MSSNLSFTEDMSAETRTLPGFTWLRTLTTGQLLLSGLVLVITSQWIARYRRTAKVPAVGYPPIPLFASWVAAYRFMRDPVGLVLQGITKYKSSPFRISTYQGEYVLVPSKESVAEYIRAPDDVLNFVESANDQQQLEFTMGYGVAFRMYHTPVVRVQLTQSIKTHIPAMLDEISRSFEDMIGSPEEWSAIAIYKTIAMTVARTSSRVFIGERLCRNEEYLQNAMDYAQAVVTTAEMIRAFPRWMKKIIIRYASVTRHRRVGEVFLRELIQERLDGKLDQNGHKFDDMMQWLVDAAPPIERTVPQLSERMMALNVASIHTTTMTFVGALYNLAVDPDKYLPELRAELMEHAPDGNITKETLPKLVKMDSFLREAGRFNNAGLMSTQRNAKKKFTFSDGTVIPPGAKVGTPLLFLHRNPELYEKPEEFDGFRFSRLKEASGGAQNAVKHTMVSTDAAYQLFGHGKHACPGRFFAVNEMKLMLCIMISRYDLKSVSGTTPPSIYVGTMAFLNARENILFKNRNIE